MVDTSAVTLRIRPRWVLLTFAVHQLALLPVMAIGWLLTGSVTSVLMGVVVVALMAWVTMWRLPIVISDAGIHGVRSGYVLNLGWDDLVSITRRKFFGPITVTAIETQPGTLTRRDGSAIAGSRATKVRSAGHDRVVMIGQCVADVRSGPFGEMLRRHRPDLVPPPP